MTKQSRAQKKRAKKAEKRLKKIAKKKRWNKMPIGEPVSVSRKWKQQKKHYLSFEYKGDVYKLGDSVLLTPESEDEMPRVAIIRDIAEAGNGLMLTRQLFYRPEDAVKRGGGTWHSQDTRELFYTFYRENVPAESVMHPCVLNFIPLNKKIPVRSLHPSYIIQKVYDPLERELSDLTDKYYDDDKLGEINLLLKNTMERLGELPDIDPEDVPAADHHDDQVETKWNLKRKSMLHTSTSRAAGASTKSENLLKVDMPGNCPSDSSDYNAILANFGVLTGDLCRDKWLEQLLKGIHQACTTKEDGLAENAEKETVTSIGNNTNGNTSAVTTIESKTESSDTAEEVSWPDSAVSAITALEKVTYEAFDIDYYNEKMEQLESYLMNNSLLARRVLNKELDPEDVLTMYSDELEMGRKRVDFERSSSPPTVEYLLNMAKWAAFVAKEPPLAANYGQLLVLTAEEQGVTLDPSILFCERCRTMLEPGKNCTVRIDRTSKKSKRYKNKVVHNCNYCHHPNRMSGTPEDMSKNYYLRDED